MSSRRIDSSQHGGQSSKSVVGGDGLIETSILYDASVQVDLLKHELQRVQAGILLLSSSIERLQEVARQDSKGCCGSTIDFLMSAIGGHGHLISVSSRSFDADDYERVNNNAQLGSPLWADSSSEHGSISS